MNLPVLVSFRGLREFDNLLNHEVHVEVMVGKVAKTLFHLCSKAAAKSVTGA